MTNNNWFLNSSLSQRLIERGVVSQFDMWCFKMSVNGIWMLGTAETVKEYGIPRDDLQIRAIHVFDLMLPDPARIVFGRKLINSPIKKDLRISQNNEAQTVMDYETLEAWQYHTKQLLLLIQSGGDVEKYIESTMV